MPETRLGLPAYSVRVHAWLRGWLVRFPGVLARLRLDREKSGVAGVMAARLG
jgi:hypothetical protein